MFHVKQPQQALETQTKWRSTWNVSRWAAHFLGNPKWSQGSTWNKGGILSLKARVEGTGEVLHQKEIVCIIVHTAQSNLRILLVQQGLSVCGRGEAYV